MLSVFTRRSGDSETVRTLPKVTELGELGFEPRPAGFKVHISNLVPQLVCQDGKFPEEGNIPKDLSLEAFSQVVKVSLSYFFKFSLATSFF